MSADQKRIKTTHVGSLIRPKEFADLLRKKMSGKADEVEYRRGLRDAVGKIVKEQVNAGIDIVSDGEFGKGIGWEQYVLERLSGIGERQELTGEENEEKFHFGDMDRFPEFYAEYWANQDLSEGIYPCVGPLEYTGHDALQRDIDNLKSAMSGAAEGFLPVAAPASAFALSPNRYYKTDEEYMHAAAEALREEYVAIVEAGLYVQIDDAHMPFMFDRMVPPATEKEFEKWARIRIEALNHALRDLPQERIRYHICWGSWNGPHVCDVPLEKIINLLLEIRTGAYCIEMANPRHEHEWEVWQNVKLPEDRKLIPGVISHATNVVEHPRLVAQRLVRLAKIVGRENVLGGTDCGFAQGPFVQRVHPSIQWAKLEALAEGAKIATSQLWK